MTDKIPVWFHTPPHIKKLVAELKADNNRLNARLKVLQYHHEQAVIWDYKTIWDYTNEVKAALWGQK